LSSPFGIVHTPSFLRTKKKGAGMHEQNFKLVIPAPEHEQTRTDADSPRF